MQAFTVPTIYTAVDRFTSPLKGMRKANQSFTQSLDNVSARSERMFRKLTPGFSSASKELLNMASTAALVGGAIASVSFSTKSIMDYETALASFKTIVSELTPEQFKPFSDAVSIVAKETKRSTIEVAQAFEKIAGLNAEFAKTPEAISAVTAAAITLSRASRDELGVSAENLVGILNQFSLGATEANRTINVLAAGQAVGAASISQTSESFKVFGAVAKQSNLSLEQSVALTEVLASKQIMGAEAGTALRGTLVKLKAAGLGYKSGLFNTRDALEEVNQKYNKLKTAKEKDALLDKVFGTINLTTGSILMNNIDLYDKFTAGVTNTSEAQKAAEINSNTLSVRLDELKNAWINMLTGSNAAGGGLEKVKDIVKAVTNNLDTIVSVGINVLKFYATWKVINLGMRAVLLVNNIAVGASIALNQGNAMALRGNIIAQGAYRVATMAATAAQWLLNVAMGANPIGLAILAVAGLSLAIYGLVKQNEKLRAEYMAQINLRTESTKKQEQIAVDKLTQSYVNLGFSIKEATAKSLQFELQNVRTARMQVEQKIAKNKTDLTKGQFIKGNNAVVSSEGRKAEKELLLNQTRAKELAVKEQQITQMAVNAANSGLLEKSAIYGILKKDYTSNPASVLSPEQMNKSLLEKNRVSQVQNLERKGRGLFNPKQAQAQANVNVQNTTTNKVEGSILVVVSDDKGKQISSSYMPVIPVGSKTW